ncbi:MAG: ATP synthase subunit I [Geobacteraceae bacterium]
MNYLVLHLSFAVLAGLALGFFHFGGLWLTVRKIPCSGRPVVLLSCSFLVRQVVTLSGIYLVMDGQLQRLLACLGGFLLMRIILTRFLGSARSESRLSA